MQKRPKYGNKREMVDGINFRSKIQAARYRDLKLAQTAGKISDLKIEFPIRAIINGQEAFKYVADAIYRIGYYVIIEDTKGYATPEFKVKWDTLRALYLKDPRCMFLLYPQDFQGEPPVWRKTRDNFAFDREYLGYSSEDQFRNCTAGSAGTAHHARSRSSNSNSNRSSDSGGVKGA